MMVIWYYRMQSKISIKFRCICLIFFKFYYYSWFSMTSLIEFMKSDIFEWPFCFSFPLACSIKKIKLVQHIFHIHFYDTRILDLPGWHFFPLILYVYIRFGFAPNPMVAAYLFRCLLLMKEIIDNDIANLQNECYKRTKKKIYPINSHSTHSHISVSSNICPMPIAYPFSNFHHKLLREMLKWWWMCYS